MNELHAKVQSLTTKDIKAHSAPVRVVGWNSTGSRLASGSQDRTVRVWNPDKLELRHSTELKGHTGTVDQLSWDPTHSDRLATVSSDKTLKLWDYRSQSQIFTIDLASPLINVSFSPDGKYIAVGGKDDTINIIDATEQKVLHSWKEAVNINELAWSNSGQLLTLSTAQGTVKLLETTNWEHLHTVEGNTSSVFCVEFDPRGKYLAAGGADALISLWDVQDWICVRTFTKLQYGVRTLSFTYDGAYIASASEDPYIDIASFRLPSRGDLLTAQSHVETGEQVHKIPVPAHMNSIAWHPSKYWLAYAAEDKGLKLATTS